MAYDKERSSYLLSQVKTKAVADELIRLNEGLIGMQLKKFGLQGDPDAISFAYEALYNAIMTFDQAKQNAFSTYAVICIYNSLGSYVRKIKTQINVNTISYDEHMMEDSSIAGAADGPILQACGLRCIHNAVDAVYIETKNTVHRDILNIWILSSFTKTNLEIANEVACSQSYVNQVINRARKVIKNKLKEVDQWNKLQKP